MHTWSKRVRLSSSQNQLHTLWYFQSWSTNTWDRHVVIFLCRSSEVRFPSLGLVNIPYGQRIWVAKRSCFEYKGSCSIRGPFQETEEASIMELAQILFQIVPPYLLLPVLQAEGTSEIRAIGSTAPNSGSTCEIWFQLWFQRSHPY